MSRPPRCQSCGDRNDTVDTRPGYPRWCASCRMAEEAVSIKILPMTTTLRWIRQCDVDYHGSYYRG